MNNNSRNETIIKVSKLAFGVNMVRTTSNKQNSRTLSRTFQGQITGFKNYDKFNKSAFFDSLLIGLKTQWGQ